MCKKKKYGNNCKKVSKNTKKFNNFFPSHGIEVLQDFGFSGIIGVTFNV